MRSIQRNDSQSLLKHPHLRPQIHVSATLYGVQPAQSAVGTADIASDFTVGRNQGALAAGNDVGETVRSAG